MSSHGWGQGSYPTDTGPDGSWIQCWICGFTVKRGTLRIHMSAAHTLGDLIANKRLRPVRTLKKEDQVSIDEEKKPKEWGERGEMEGHRWLNSSGYQEEAGAARRRAEEEQRRREEAATALQAFWKVFFDERGEEQRRREEAEAARQRAEEEAETARRRAKEEQHKREEAEAARRHAEEEQHKREEAEAIRRRAEEEQRKREEAEAARRRAKAEAEAILRRAEEEQRKREEAESARRRAEEERRTSKSRGIFLTLVLLFLGIIVYGVATLPRHPYLEPEQPSPSVQQDFPGAAHSSPSTGGIPGTIAPFERERPAPQQSPLAASSPKPSLGTSGLIAPSGDKPSPEGRVTPPSSGEASGYNQKETTALEEEVIRHNPPKNGPEIWQQQGLPAARWGMDLSREGKKLLPVEEQHELDALYAEALQALTPEERQQFLTIAQKGPAANDREVTESAKLIEKALRPLPQGKSARLGTLVGKAVRLQLAQEKPPAIAGQQ